MRLLRLIYLNLSIFDAALQKKNYFVESEAAFYFLTEATEADLFKLAYF